MTFNKGDKVRCINAVGAFELEEGAEYTVASLFAGDLRLDGLRASWVASRFEKVQPEPEDTDDAYVEPERDDSERYYLTCDGISGVRCEEHGTECPGPRNEDTDVEPEPLKEGDWVLVWAKVSRAEPDDEGDLLFEAHSGSVVYEHPDAIVRPSAGQVPPWLVLPPLEEPKGIGAVVEAEVSGSDRHSFVRVDTADGTPCRWRSTYDGCGYEWAALEEPTLTRVGVHEDGAS